jgi:hypothetical protein
MFRPRGKYTKINMSNPLALGRCDYSGFLVRHADLVPQLQYRGAGALVDTKYLVHRNFVDTPNPQDLTPLVMPDPIPIQNPRPDNDDS